MRPKKKRNLKKTEIVIPNTQINEIKTTPSVSGKKAVKEIITRLPNHCTQLLFLS